MFRALIGELPEFAGVHVDADSAGIAASAGAPAATSAIEAMRKRGIDISGHRARSLGDGIPEYDLILTMTEEHKAQVLLRHPEVAANVYTLKEYARSGGSKDISDPFGMGDETYERTLDEIEAAVRGAIRRLAEERGKS